MIRCLLVVVVGGLVGLAGRSQGDEPEVELSGVKISLVAEQPDVSTPTGIDVDKDGNVWVLSCHTHFRPDDYEGPEHDEVVVLQSGGQRKIFYARTEATMDLELGTDGWVYLAERDRILRVRDSNNDGIGDIEENLAVLDTEADYPHNGLSGLAWHPSGDLIFALGENFWREWTLTASDRSFLKGTGEGGIFRCAPDGSNLRRVARGFWNPFGVCVRRDGTMFAAENDPGVRPPCRLLHVVEGADFGYQRLYGNAPFHPFVCWDGELRGTLPMLYSVGEAPCGIAPLGNGLLVTSWTENRVDFYPLRAKGASFETERLTMAKGSRSFRPTCIAQASPTVFYFTDWVTGSYNVHGKGRVWKIEVDPEVAAWLPPMKLAKPTQDAVAAQKMAVADSAYSNQALFAAARSEDPYLRHGALKGLELRCRNFTVSDAEKLAGQDTISLLLALKKSRPKDERWVEYFWGDSRTDVRFETLRWIADEELTGFSEHVNKVLSSSSSDYRLFEAALAALNRLSGNPRAGVVDKDLLVARVTDPNTSDQSVAYVLRLLDPGVKAITEAQVRQWVNTGNVMLIADVVQWLSNGQRTFKQPVLNSIVTNDALPDSVRADALAGMDWSGADSRELAMNLLQSTRHALRDEMLRQLRFQQHDEEIQKVISDLGDRYVESRDLALAALDPSTLTKNRPPLDDITAWRKRLNGVEQPADRKAGRRVFFNSKIGTCANCHRHNGRGNVVGPDLSVVAHGGHQEQLLTALLQPSQSVDPQYFPWQLLLDDGLSFTGILLRDGGGGTEFYRDALGNEKKILTKHIEIRKTLRTSMMPEGLVHSMTDREIRDVLAFLDQSERSEAR